MKSATEPVKVPMIFEENNEYNIFGAAQVQMMHVYLAYI